MRAWTLWNANNIDCCRGAMPRIGFCRMKNLKEWEKIGFLPSNQIASVVLPWKSARKRKFGRLWLQSWIWSDGHSCQSENTRQPGHAKFVKHAPHLLWLPWRTLPDPALCPDSWSACGNWLRGFLDAKPASKKYIACYLTSVGTPILLILRLTASIFALNELGPKFFMFFLILA